MRHLCDHASTLPMPSAARALRAMAAPSWAASFPVSLYFYRGSAVPLRPPEFLSFSYGKKQALLARASDGSYSRVGRLILRLIEFC